MGFPSQVVDKIVQFVHQVFHVGLLGWNWYVFKRISEINLFDAVIKPKNKQECSSDVVGRSFFSNCDVNFLHRVLDD